MRELGAGPSLLLLYGDEGVGKTRTLEEMLRTRLGEFKVHWVDLQAGESGDGALLDSSAMIESTFSQAQPGDIIIADHFQEALKKSRHQLFLNWSRDGIDKSLKLIIAGDTDSFNELRQLAQQYHVRVQSFQQMPFSADEAAAFLGFYLFPDRPVGKLSIPPLLRNQLSKAQGNVGKIIEITERAGDQIKAATTGASESIRQGSKIIVGVLAAIVVAVSVGWYLLSSELIEDDLQIADAGYVARQADLGAAAITSEPVTTASAELAAAPQDTAAVDSQAPVSESATPVAVANESVPADDRSAADSAEQQRDAGIAVAAVSASGSEAATGSEAETETETETETEAGTGAEAATDLVVGSEPGARTEPEAEPEAEAETEPEAEPEPEPEPETAPEPAITTAGAVAGTATLPPAGQGRLARDLQSSLDWINSRDSKIGTLQIMLLSLDRFNENNYYEYLDNLASNAVDISAIRIFTTRTGDRDSYSVVYGEYDSRKAASESKDKIPRVLQKISPVPRSVGGLIEEIERLHAKN